MRPLFRASTVRALSRRRESAKPGSKLLGKRACRLEQLESRALLSIGSVGLEYLPPQHYLFNEGGYLSGPATGAPRDIAMSFLADNVEELGLTAEDLQYVFVTDEYASADNGLTHVTFGQQLRGTEIVNAIMKVNVTADGRVFAAGGGLSPNMRQWESQTADLVLNTPPIDAAQAVRLGGALLGLSDSASPQAVAGAALTPFETSYRFLEPTLSQDVIEVEPRYVYTPAGLEPTWQMVLRTPDNRHSYQTLISQSSGQIVLSTDWVKQLSYNVFPAPVESPLDGVRAVVSEPFGGASPYGWHDVTRDYSPDFRLSGFPILRGNNTWVEDDWDGSNETTGYSYPALSTAFTRFDYSLDLGAGAGGSINAGAGETNLFYWVNLSHDIHYAYGFNEAAHNYQMVNFGGSAGEGDYVLAHIQDPEADNNAWFMPTPDGTVAYLSMGVFSGTDRDSVFENTIIAHEYGHGVSTRVVGSGYDMYALDGNQSGGMGEGWSDFWALMFTQKATDTQNGSYTMGEFVTNDPLGIRRYPYSYDMLVNPLTYGSYNGGYPNNEVHNVGEIYTSILWDLNWLLLAKDPFQANIGSGYAGLGSGGNKLTLQLVMDSLKLLPTRPTFVDGRDSMLLADQNRTGLGEGVGANYWTIWNAFARRGVGLSANDGGSDMALAVTEAFDLPAVTITGSSPTGIVTGAGVNKMEFTFRGPMDRTDFSIAQDVASFTGPGGGNLKGQITGFTWNATGTKLTVNFNTQTNPGEYRMVLNPSFRATLDRAANDEGRWIDQDQDGIAGEPIDDQYSTSFYFDSDQIHVVSTSPVDGSLISSPEASIRFNFSQYFDPTTVQAADLVLSAGTVSEARVLDADTVEFRIANLVTEGLLTVQLGAGSISDLYGTGVAPYLGTFQVDVGTTTLPGISPAGTGDGLIAEGTVTGTISAASDTDSFTFNLDAGQRITVLVEPDALQPTLQPTIQVRGPGNALLGTTTAARPGSAALLQTVNAVVAGQYKVTVGSAWNTTGGYSARVVLNAALEAEEYIATVNDVAYKSQDLDASFIDVGAGATRGAVLGQGDRWGTPLPVESEAATQSGGNDTYLTAESAQYNFSPFQNNVLYHMGLSGAIDQIRDIDWFRIGVLHPGDRISISDSGVSGQRGTLRDPQVWLVRANNGQALTVASNDDGGPGTDGLISRFVIDAEDTYYVVAGPFESNRVNDPEIGTYELGIWLQSAQGAPGTGTAAPAEKEPNNRVGQAQNASASWRPTEYLSRTSGTVLPGDVDVFKYRFEAGDLVSVNVVGSSAMNAAVRLLNAAGNTLAVEDDSEGTGVDAPIYGYRIATSGDYYVEIASQPAGRGYGAYSADVYVSTAAILTRAKETPDFYRFTLTDRQLASLALSDAPAGAYFELFDGNLNLIARSAADASGAQVLRNFADPTQDALPSSYFVRVTADQDDYQLLITRSGDLESMPPIGVQDLSGARGVLGNVDPSLNPVDYYRFRVNEGDTIRLATFTPADGAYLPVNDLDPSIRLLDPEGNEVDTGVEGTDLRNESLSYLALASGYYTVEVSPQTLDGGTYFLQVDLGASTATGVAPAVTATAPADEAFLNTFPLVVRVDFSETIAATTVDPGDLMVNDRPAVGVRAIDGDSFEFTLDRATRVGDGAYTVTLPAGAVRDLQGLGNVAYVGQFTLDTVGARIASILWNGAALPAGRTLTLTGGDLTLSLVLTEELAGAPTEASFRLFDRDTLQTYTPSPGDVLYDAAERRVTAVFHDVPDGRWTLTLPAGGFLDRAGNAMDGEPLGTAIDATPTGNNSPGGDYALSFSMDVASGAFPVPLTARDPIGSLVYEGQTTGVIASSGDEDLYTIALDAGQRLSVGLDPDAMLAARLVIEDPSGGVLDDQVAYAAGVPLLSQRLEVAQSGVYRLRISCLNGEAGAYRLRLALNAGLEGESFGGPINDARTVAEPLPLTSWVDSATYGAVAAVLEVPFPSFSAAPLDYYQIAIRGTVHSAADLDWFNLGTMNAGDTLTVSLAGLAGARGLLADPVISLYRNVGGVPVLVAQDDNSGPGSDALLLDRAIATTGQYYLLVDGASTATGSYTAGIRLRSSTPPALGSGGVAESETNDGFSQADVAGNSWRRVNYRSSTSAALTPDDVDLFGCDLTLGSLVSVEVTAAPGLDVRVALVDSFGNRLAAEDGTSAGLGANSAIYAFRADRTGNYFVEVQAASGSGDYSVDMMLSSSVAPAVVPPRSDYYVIDLEVGQRLTLAMTGDDAGINMRLERSGGAAVGTITYPGNTEERLGWTVDADGTYYVKVSGNQGGNYVLVATTQLEFEAEPNDSLVAAQPIDAARRALGAFTETDPSDDWYSLAAGLGEGLFIRTSTPAGGPGEFVNLLDPTIELYGPSGTLIPLGGMLGYGTAADGRNEWLGYVIDAPAKVGEYMVRVSQQGSSGGEYVLDVAREGVAVGPNQVSVGEDGTTSSYQVMLTSPISVDTTVWLVPDSADVTAEDSANPGNPYLTFTPANWYQAQTVLVSVADDPFAEGPMSALVHHTVAGDPAYVGVKVFDVRVDIGDDDTAGVQFDRPSLALPEGDSGEVTVSLNSIPMGVVRVAVTSSDPSRVSLSAAELVFDPMLVAPPPVALTVSGADNDKAEGDQTVAIQFQVVEGDPQYMALTIPDFVVTLSDDDVAGISVTAAGAQTSEDGSQVVTFDVVLASEPTAPVVLSLASNDEDEGLADRATLTFDAQNWNVPQTVTVTGTDDQVDDGDQAYKIVVSVTQGDATYLALPAAEVSLVNVDDDTAGITVTPTSGLETGESFTTASFTVRLNSEPSAPVVINLSSSAPAEGDVDLAILTFDSTNWSTPQTVLVTGADDELDDGDIDYSIVLTASTAASEYAAIDPDDVALKNIDNDVSALLVSIPSGQLQVRASEAGTQDTLTVRLACEPAAPVTISVVSGNPAEGIADLAILAFDSTNWSTPQTVTVTGQDDGAVIDGDQNYVIRLAVTAGDVNYVALAPTDVPAVNADNDSPGIRVAYLPESGLTTSEAGLTAGFSIVLTSQPTDKVRIDVSSSNMGEGVVTPTFVEFDASNWSTPQDLTVTGMDDRVDDDDAPYLAVIQPAISSDPNYSGLDAGDVPVTNTDDDTAGVLIVPTAGLVTDETGLSAQFSVVLQSKPLANVRINLQSDDPGEGSPTASYVEFTPLNWNVAQNVVVTGVADSIVDENVTYHILTENAVSAGDLKYDGLDVSDVTLVNNNVDAQGIVGFASLFAQNLGAAGDRWFSFQNVRAGWVTVQATGSSGSRVELALYDSSRNELARAAGQGSQRLDHLAAGPGGTYLLRLTGSADVELRLVNQVQPDGTSLQVQGNSTADALSFDTGASRLVVNGVSYVVDASVTRVTLAGGGGDDVFQFTGDGGSDRVEFRPKSATIASGGRTIVATDMTRLTAVSGGGEDRLVLYDSNASDIVTLRPDQAFQTDSARTYSLGAFGFPYVQAIAASGYDTAVIYDSAGNDRLIMSPSDSWLTGVGFWLNAHGYDRVYALSLQGQDTAKMYDSNGSDRFVSTPQDATMSGSGYGNRAIGFDYVQAFASNGYDEASVYDGSGSDLLEADRNWLRLSISNGGNSSYLAGFDRIQAISRDGTAANQKRCGSALAHDFLFLKGLW